MEKGEKGKGRAPSGEGGVRGVRVKVCGNWVAGVKDISVAPEELSVGYPKRSPLRTESGITVGKLNSHSV